MGVRVKMRSVARLCVCGERGQGRGGWFGGNVFIQKLPKLFCEVGGSCV